MRKIAFVVLLVCGVGASVSAQQLTRFAVVDMARVHSVFFLESAPARQLEQDSIAVQAEINRQNQEIQGLRAAHLAAVSAGDQAQALRLQDEVRVRTEFLVEFHTVNAAELTSRRRTLMQTDDFLARVYNDIRFVAEREGFTMVLNLNDNPSILWFSPTVDITDSLIQRLLERR